MLHGVASYAEGKLVDMMETSWASSCAQEGPRQQEQKTLPLKVGLANSGTFRRTEAPESEPHKQGQMRDKERSPSQGEEQEEEVQDDEAAPRRRMPPDMEETQESDHVIMRQRPHGSAEEISAGGGGRRGKRVEKPREVARRTAWRRK